MYTEDGETFAKHTTRLKVHPVHVDTMKVVRVLKADVNIARKNISKKVNILL